MCSMVLVKAWKVFGALIGFFLVKIVRSALYVDASRRNYELLTTKILGQDFGYNEVDTIQAV